MNLFSYIRSILRRGWLRYPERTKALKNAKVSVSEGRIRVKFICNKCKKLFRQNEVQVDHIIECGSLKSFEDMKGFTERLFCDSSDLQILCRNCHKNKK